MIAIISEHRYTEQEIEKFRAQRIKVNYTLLPQFYHNYSDEIAKANSRLIRNPQIDSVIIRVENYYAGTKEAIEKALLFKKKVRIITPSGDYKLFTMEDWKTVYKDSSSRIRVEKHPVLIEFEEHTRMYYEKINTKKLTEAYTLAVDGLTESDEEIERFTRTFAPLYKLEYDANDWKSVCSTYKSLKYYYDNNIEYGLDIVECLSHGAIAPEDSTYFTNVAFDTTINTYEEYGVEYFGDEELLEDSIYKKGDITWA